MIYFVAVVLAITAVVQAILLYKNKNMEDFYIEEQRLAMKYQAELEARLLYEKKYMEDFYIEEQRLAMEYQAELEARLAHAEREVELLRLPTQEVDQQIDEAVRLANQERNINE